MLQNQGLGKLFSDCRSLALSALAGDGALAHLINDAVQGKQPTIESVLPIVSKADKKTANRTLGGTSK